MPTILLIEDNEMNRDMLSRRLQRHGYEVRIAVNGRDGIEKAHAENPNLILMDLHLPEMDGWEATIALKQDELTRKIPVIALTAHALVSDKDRAIQAGCDEFATKPIDFSGLLNKITRLLTTPHKTA